MTAISSCRFIVLLSTLLLVRESFCMINNIDVHIGYEIRSLHQFKFAVDGVLRVHLNKDDDESIISDGSNSVGKSESSKTSVSNKFEIYHCTDVELARLSKYSTMNNLCSNIDSFGCSNSMNIAEQSDYTFRSLHNQWMSVIAVNCDEQTIHPLSMSVLAINPDGEYLSMSMVPFKQMYIYFSMIWITIGMLWFCHYCYFGYVSHYYNNKLQQLLMICPVIECLLCIFSHFYWMHSSLHGTESMMLSTMCNITSSLNYALVALLAMFITEGWSFLYYSLAQGNIRIQIEIYLIAFLIFVTSLVQQYFMSVIIITIIACILCVRRLVAGYTRNIQQMAQQQSILEEECNSAFQDADAIVAQSPIAIKIRMLTFFFRGMIIFFAVWILVYWSDTLLSQVEWLCELLRNIMLVCLVMYSGWCLKLNAFEPHLFIPGEEKLYFSVHSMNKQLQNNTMSNDEMYHQCLSFDQSKQITYVVESETSDKHLAYSLLKL